MYAIYTFGPQIMTEFGLGAGQEAILGESAVSLFFLVGTSIFSRSKPVRRRSFISRIASLCFSESLKRSINDISPGSHWASSGTSLKYSFFQLSYGPEIAPLRLAYYLSLF